jgi:cytochrome c biogenesis protein CcdA
VFTRRFAVVRVALAVLAVGLGARLAAHEGHIRRVMGTMTMAMADHVMLKDKADKEVTIKVTKATKVKAKPAIKVEEIKPGTRVVVTAVEQKDKSLTATLIEVGAAPAATK